MKDEWNATLEGNEVPHIKAQQIKKSLRKAPPK